MGSKSRPEIYLMLHNGISAAEIVQAGYAPATVYRASSHYKRVVLPAFRAALIKLQPKASS